MRSHSCSPADRSVCDNVWHGGGSVQMESVTSLASAAVLGMGSMIGFNNSIKTLRDLSTGASKDVCDTWPGFAGLSPLACHSQTALGLSYDSSQLTFSNFWVFNIEK